MFFSDADIAVDTTVELAKGSYKFVGREEGLDMIEFI
jgi:hypothetical protein